MKRVKIPTLWVTKKQMLEDEEEDERIELGASKPDDYFERRKFWYDHKDTETIVTDCYFPIDCIGNYNSTYSGKTNFYQKYTGDNFICPLSIKDFELIVFGE